MPTLNLPSFAARIKGSREQPYIFDRLRRKYVALTPEEWVRQHFVNYLITQKGYPPSLLANEVSLTVGEGKTLRADTVLFAPTLQARMIVEYKASSVPISEKVLEQAAAYNTLLHVDYLVVSNGIKHYCCRVDYEDRKYVFLDDIPVYDAL